MARNSLRPTEPEPDEESEELVAIDPAETELFDKVRDLDYDDIMLVSGKLLGVDTLFISINHAKDIENDEPVYEPLYVRLTPDMAQQVTFGGEDEEQEDDVEGEVTRRGPAKRAAKDRESPAKGRGKKKA
jgi:hypothetical protein